MDAEFAALQEELDKIPVAVHRGNVEYGGGNHEGLGKEKIVA